MDLQSVSWHGFSVSHTQCSWYLVRSFQSVLRSLAGILSEVFSEDMNREEKHIEWDLLACVACIVSRWRFPVFTCIMHQQQTRGEGVHIEQYLLASVYVNRPVPSDRYLFDPASNHMFVLMLPSEFDCGTQWQGKGLSLTSSSSHILCFYILAPQQSAIISAHIRVSTQKVLR